MSNSNEHLFFDVPTIIVAGEMYGLGGGRHLRLAQGAPLANLQLTLMDKMGVQIEKFGDSNGQLHPLAV